MPTRPTRLTCRIALAVAASALVAACGGGDTTPAAADTSTAGTTTAGASPSTPVAEIDREDEAGERPEDLPDDVPVPAGLRSVLRLGGDETSIGFSGSLTDTDPASAADGLAAALEGDGWTVEQQDTGMEEVAGLTARRGDEQYTAAFTLLGDLVSVQLTYAAG